MTTELEQDTAWLHLAPGALLFLCFRAVIRWLRENVPIVLGAGAGAAFVDAISAGQIAAIGVVALTVGVSLCIAYYRRFRFRLQGRRLIVQKGLLERSEVDLNAEQVQQVMLDRPLYLRLFGLVRVSIDTAGGSTAEVELPGIREQIARQLHERLQSESAAAANAESGPLARIGFGDLVMHGLASNHAWLLFAAMLPLLQRLHRPLEEYWQQWPWTRAFGDWLLATWFALPLLGLLLLLVFVSLSVAAVLMRYGGYELTQVLRQESVLRQSGGVLTQREQFLSLSRLQLVEWIQTPAGRLCNRCHLVCRQFGSVEDSRDLSSQVFTIPGLTPARARPLLQHLHMPTVPSDQRLNPVHRHYRRVLMLRQSLILALLVTAIGWQLQSPWPLLGLLPGLPLLFALAHLRWRAVAWQDTPTHELLIRHGIVGRRISLFRMRNVQYVRLRQSIWQRRRGLVSMQLALATGTLMLPYLRAEDAWRLAAIIRRETRSEGHGRSDTAAAPELSALPASAATPPQTD